MFLYKTLKRLRVLLSLFVFVGMSYYFAMVRAEFIVWFSPIKWQFIPAVLGTFAAAAWVLLILLLISLLFGRLYCSTLCPLGTLQDINIRIAKFFEGKKRKQFAYRAPHNLLRYGLLAVVAACFLVGLTLPLLLLDPYSNFGRIASLLCRPIMFVLNNFASHIAPDHIYYQSYAPLSWASYFWPALFLLLVVWLSTFRGRLFCNTLCPAGSCLGLVSKYAAFRPSMDASKCNHCGLCSMKCKAECINSKEGSIDHSRCVMCFNCLTVCKKDALHYSFSWQAGKAKVLPAAQSPSPSIPSSDSNTSPASRRKFFLTAGGVVGAAAVYRLSTDGGALLGAPKDKKGTISPPGCGGVERLKQFCTACQACVTACPSHIIRPTLQGYGLDGLMLPALSYEHGFCNYDCKRCAEVCPTHAILPLSLEEKKLVRIGKAKLHLRRCIVITDGTDCGACDEHCPTKAVHMVPTGENSLREPVVDVEYCIGCGGCEFICPATPKAIEIHALAVHEIADFPEVEEQKKVEDVGFGF
jgi:Polyferredoxin